MKKIIGIAVALFSLYGCAYKSDTYKVERDTYMITGTSDDGYAGAKKQAMEAASKTCAKSGKSMQIKNTQQHHSYLFWSVDVIFSCVNEKTDQPVD